MRRLLGLWCLVSLAAVAAPAAAQDETPSDRMYRCEGRVPLYTNRSSYGCPEYELRGRLSIAGNDGLFPERRREPRPAPALGPVPAVPAPAIESAVCELYEEWLALNEQTAGGFFYQDTRQTARWYELAKLFSAIGVPFHACGS